MPKDISITIRVDEDEKKMLDTLAKTTVRTTSDMVRYLIRQAYSQAVHETMAKIQPYEEVDQ